MGPSVAKLQNVFAKHFVITSLYPLNFIVCAYQEQTLSLNALKTDRLLGYADGVKDGAL